jgi:hypothetical protein
MTKLEEKLDELDYEQETYLPAVWYKKIAIAKIWIDTRNGIEGRLEIVGFFIQTDEELKILNKAFDTMKKDLKILKEIEHEERSKKNKSSTSKL